MRRRWGDDPHQNDVIPHVEIPNETITDTHLEIIWIKTKVIPQYILELTMLRLLRTRQVILVTKTIIVQ